MRAKSITAYNREFTAVLEGTQVSDRRGRSLPIDEGAVKAVEMLRQAARAGNKVMLVGNGGSSAVVAHAKNDLCKAAGIKAMVFTEQSLLTALSNDISYAAAYEFQVKMWAASGDVLVAVSSSGRSENILRAVAAARPAGSGVVTFSGFRPDNPLRSQGDLNFYCSSDTYGHVETAHAALLHYVTDSLMPQG